MKKNKIEVLKHLRDECSCCLKAAEDWDETYKKDEETFEKLVRLETKLENELKSYFKDFSGRVVQHINWLEYRNRVVKAYEVIVDIQEELFEQEEIILKGHITQPIIDLTALGAIAGQKLYNIDLGMSNAHEMVLKSARTQVADLVKGVSKTTKKRIRQSIAISIELGESNDEATQRLQKIIKNPKRAELIARTESVNAYQDGLMAFAKESGATSKTWQTTALKVCHICIPLNGITLPIDESFQTKVGPRLKPTAHPRCKCGMVYNYD